MITVEVRQKLGDAVYYPVVLQTFFSFPEIAFIISQINMPKHDFGLEINRSKLKFNLRAE